MGHRAKAALARATIRFMRQETRIRFTHRHLIRSIYPGPDRPAVNPVPHLRAAILTPAVARRVGILPAAIVAEAARIAPAVVAARAAVEARTVAVAVAQVEAAAGAGAHMVAVVEVAALIIEFTTLNQPHRQL
jgi:hypothetical protein